MTDDATLLRHHVTLKWRSIDRIFLQAYVPKRYELLVFELCPDYGALQRPMISVQVCANSLERTHSLWRSR